MKEILQQISSYSETFDHEKIERAFSILNNPEICDDDRREHSFNACKLVLPFHPDQSTLLVMLLHNVYANKLISEAEVREYFGHDVANMLIHTSSLEILKYRENDKTAQLEALRKLFLSMAKDLRVILVRLACRMDRLQHLDEFLKKKEDKLLFAEETFDVYIPVAARLGIYRMKMELEDLCFRYINPEEYKKVFDRIQELGEERNNFISKIKAVLHDFLIKRGIKSEISGRVKSIYSIYKKMKVKGFDSMDDLNDIFAIRIILPSEVDENGNEQVSNLYSTLGLIHSNWKSLSRKFKDYVAVPKSNGYRSLHTVILGLVPEIDRPVEVQIRTSNMHREAEYGLASHWLYKQYKGKNNDDMLKYQIEWIKGLEKVQEDLGAESKVIREVEVDIFKDRIFVLTPKGEVRDLPVGSTCLDFAYNVHTDIGNKCVLAKVNGHAVPLNYELKNSDIVEILTKKDSTPKLQWLSMVRTPLAEKRIKNWFSKLNKDNFVKEGRLLINKQLEKLGRSSLDPSYSILRYYGGRRLNLSQRESLLEEVGRGHKAAVDIVRKVFSYENVLSGVKAVQEEAKVNRTSFKELLEMDAEKKVLIGGESGLPVKFGMCCNPKFGDKILAYVTRGNRVTVHRTACTLVDGLTKKRVMHASWKGVDDEFGGEHYKFKLVIVAISRIGLLRDVTAVISSLAMDILDLRLEPDGEKTKNYVLIDTDSLPKILLLINKLKKIPNVVDVIKED